MGYLINARDLGNIQITALELGVFFVSARCPLCHDLVSLRIGVSDVEMRREVATDCRSGGDWPHFFQLSARYSPDETDDPSGLDVWGQIGD